MTNQDFTLETYKSLLIALKKSDYEFVTFEHWCKEKKNGKIVILRHDVDLKAINSLRTAEIESELGISTTYYFRVIPQSNQPEIIKSIVRLGHEVGYHYEDISIFSGSITHALSHFKKQLEYFRQYYPVSTICMHGSPTSKFDNRDLWKAADYHDYKVIGEPYFDFLNIKDVEYFTDTARMWNGEKYNVRDKSINNDFTNEINKNIHSTFDLINWINTSENSNPVMITTHPQRWTDNKFEWTLEYIGQNLKNIIKRIIIYIRKQ